MQFYSIFLDMRTISDMKYNYTNELLALFFQVHF